MKRDPLAWAALAAAIVVTASAEYELSRACGFNEVVAGGVPAALDIYAVRALRARRDVLAVVVAMIAVNAASHLVSAGLVPVNVPLVVAVSAIAPLVMWRVHALREEGSVPANEPLSEQPRTRRKVRAAVPDEDELTARVREDFPEYADKPIPYRLLRERYGIGQQRAKRIRQRLTGT
jgi:hypothetical protein